MGVGVQLPSLAAVAVLAVFTQTGIWVDDGFGWGFGGWFVGGALAVSALVRMVGLWTVVPVPPLVFVVVAVGNAGWERQSRRLAWWGSTRELGADAVPLLVHGFPWMAAAVGAALVVAAVRVFSRGRRKCRSSSTAVAVGG